MAAEPRLTSPHTHPIIFSLENHGLSGIMGQGVIDPFDEIRVYLDRFNINEDLKTKTREKLNAIKEKVARIKREFITRPNTSIFTKDWDLYGRLKNELKDYLILYLSSADGIQAADRVLENDQIIRINTILNKYLSDDWRNIKLGGRRKKTRRRRRANNTKRRHVGKKH
jgi:hypothetical protein